MMNKYSRKWPKIQNFMNKFKNRLHLVFMEMNKSKKLLLACFSVDQESFCLIKLFLEVTLMFYFSVTLQLLSHNFLNLFKKLLLYVYIPVEKALRLLVSQHLLQKIRLLDNFKLKAVL